MIQPLQFCPRLNCNVRSASSGKQLKKILHLFLFCVMVVSSKQKKAFLTSAIPRAFCFDRAVQPVRHISHRPAMISFSILFTVSSETFPMAMKSSERHFIYHISFFLYIRNVPLLTVWRSGSRLLFSGAPWQQNSIFQPRKFFKEFLEQNLKR